MITYLKINLMKYLLFVVVLFANISAEASVFLKSKGENMIAVRRATERGINNSSWLKSAFTFSFADYHDPNHMSFRSLRVMNEDKIKAQSGFEPHFHKNMEIITYVIQGTLEHRDSMGNTIQIRQGEVQRMTAGSGVMHSEYNPEKKQETHLYQIWILPNKLGVQPNYVQKSFETKLKKNKLALVISKDAREDSIPIDQDVDLYISRLSKNDTINFEMNSNRYIWVQVIKGKININGYELNVGDGLSAKIEESQVFNFTSLDNSEFMLFDLS